MTDEEIYGMKPMFVTELLCETDSGFHRDDHGPGRPALVLPLCTRTETGYGGLMLH